LNKKRAVEEGFVGSAGAAGAVGDGKVVGENVRTIQEAVEEVQLRPEDYEDVTDWTTVGFRYRY
jgi:hypothetical protein